MISSKPKNLIIAYLLLIFLGWIGVHKFYLRQIKPAIIYLIIYLFCFVPYVSIIASFVLLILIIIDLFTLPGKVKSFNYEYKKNIDCFQKLEKEQQQAKQKSKQEKEKKQTSKHDWHDDPATDKQIQYLNSLGLKYKSGMTKGDVSKLIDSRPPDKEQREFCKFFDIKIPRGSKYNDAEKIVDDYIEENEKDYDLFEIVQYIYEEINDYTSEFHCKKISKARYIETIKSLLPKRKKSLLNFYNQGVVGLDNMEELIIKAALKLYPELEK